jgi:hypothetical protein
MKLPSLSFRLVIGVLLLAFVPALQAAEGKTVMPTGDAKKLANRYALTKTRIDTLLSARLHPIPLPTTTLPNPFYKPDAAVPVAQPDKTETVVIPDAPDATDIDTLFKYAATLKIGGYLTLGGSPHVALNSIICKVGDVITVGNKDHPIFLRIDAITQTDFTLKLNEASLTIAIRK